MKFLFRVETQTLFSPAIVFLAFSMMHTLFDLPNEAVLNGSSYVAMLYAAAAT